MKIWYLAHPARSDEHYTVVENLAHVVKIQQTLLEAGIITIAPWYSWVVLYKDSAPDEVLSVMLELDKEVIRRLEGRVILAGHRLSPGMRGELDETLSLPYCEVVNLINIPDDQITKMTWL